MLTLSIIAYAAIGLIWGICDLRNAVEVDENNEVIKTPERA